LLIVPLIPLVSSKVKADDDISSSNSSDSASTPQLISVTYYDKNGNSTTTPIASSPTNPSGLGTVSYVQLVNGSGGNWSWKYKATYKGDNVSGNKIASTLYKAFEAVVSSYIAKRVGGWKGAASASLVTSVMPVSKSKNYYWTTKKYVDEDNAAIYVKWSTKLYSNSSRTKLVSSYDAVTSYMK